MTEVADVPAWDIPFSREEYNERLARVRGRMECSRSTACC